MYGDDKVIEQIIKQVNKLVDVFKVVDLIENVYIECEMMLIKVVMCIEVICVEVKCNVDIFWVNILDVLVNNYIMEVMGIIDKFDVFVIIMVQCMEIIEFFCIGVCGLVCGECVLRFQFVQLIK